MSKKKGTWAENSFDFFAQYTEKHYLCTLKHHIGQYMTYILQTIEVKNASQKLVNFVKRLGEEKHARMEERKRQYESGQMNNIEVIRI